MPKAHHHAAMGGTPDDIEAAFYEALQSADIEKLMACWADEDYIACIHPGGPRVVGAGAIRAAFETMFAHGGSIQARPEQVRRVDSRPRPIDAAPAAVIIAGFVAATSGTEMVMDFRRPRPS